jgi:hypothetical protein
VRRIWIQTYQWEDNQLRWRASDAIPPDGVKKVQPAAEIVRELADEAEQLSWRIPHIIDCEGCLATSGVFE